MKPVLLLVLLTSLAGQVTCKKVTQVTDLTAGTSTIVHRNTRRRRWDHGGQNFTKGSTSNPSILSNSDANKCLQTGNVYFHQRVPHEGDQVSVVSQVECNQRQVIRLNGSDILVPPQQRQKRHATNLGKSRRKRVVDTSATLWTNAIIPFIWDPP
ncbi:hypothetical protein C0Q70_10294 [Pomacea canaliculata]|uniref:Uncharacterized protein n=1 Tax=Pomacea canaliculata TaxID=400727 RepID=A0A2T7PC77_POMCA|nr:hypothetical protein C0Q70_10294 [Pomacea canaliculata]